VSFCVIPWLIYYKKITTLEIFDEKFQRPKAGNFSSEKFLGPEKK